MKPVRPWREGSISVEISPTGHVRVIVDRPLSEGGRYTVIEQFHCEGGVTSHTVTALGINAAMKRAHERELEE
jgi:hypothetical protein